MSFNREFGDTLNLARGKITISSGKQIECYLKLAFNSDQDNIEISCHFYLTDRDVVDVIQMLDSRKVQYASFDGSLSQGGTILIGKIGLDSGSLTSYSPKDQAIPKYELKLENLLIILGRLGIVASLYNFLHSNFLVTLRYITVSPISVKYEDFPETEEITLKWGLCNLEFGQRNLDTFRMMKETFSVYLSLGRIEFGKTDTYDYLISKLVKEGGSAVTCHATHRGYYTNPNHLFRQVNSLCFLLSLATSNWVTPAYCDLFRDNKLVQTIVFNTKRRSFINSRYLINIRNIQDLKDYLEIACPKYDELIKELPLNKCIDYIISSLASHTLQDSFIIAYIGLENLCNRIEEFSEKRGNKIEPQSIRDMKNLLRKLFTKFHKSFSDEELDFIAKKVAYKEISIKQAQKYIFNTFNVNYKNKTIDSLYEIRNSLFHGSDYEQLPLRIKMNELYDLISESLLKMLGWKGAYISKQRGNLPTELD